MSSQQSSTTTSESYKRNQKTPDPVTASKVECPLDNKCLTTNIVYEATITSNAQNNEVKTYMGISEGPFKKRFANHKKSFNHVKHKKETELSKEYWKIKNKGEIPNSGKCNLCLNEKKFILEQCEFSNILNKRDEIISKCRYKNKFRLNRLHN